jgi:hypothetical protein
MDLISRACPRHPKPRLEIGGKMGGEQALDCGELCEPEKGGRGHLRRYPTDFEMMCLELNAPRLMKHYRCGRLTIERWMEALPPHVAAMWKAQDVRRLAPAKAGQFAGEVGVPVYFFTKDKRDEK